MESYPTRWNAVRDPTKVAAIALANKLARMAWAMMARNERSKEPAATYGVNEITPETRRDFQFCIPPAPSSRSGLLLAIM
jgi:hypothetical protein